MPPPAWVLSGPPRVAGDRPAGWQDVRVTATVRTEIAEGVATLALERPPANVLDAATAHALGAAAGDLVGRGDVRAVVVTGGERIFCGGADIKEMATFAGPAQAQAFAEVLGAALLAIEGLPFVTIAAIEGSALGGGLELALACDLRVAAEPAVLGLPEVGLGIMPGAGGTQRLPRAVGLDRARELVLTGRRLSVAEAQAIGLVHEVVPAGAARERASALARGFAAGPTAAYAAVKAALRAAGGDLRMGLAVERDAFAGLFATEDRAEGLAAFAEKRQPRFTGR